MRGANKVSVDRQKRPEHGHLKGIGCSVLAELVQSVEIWRRRELCSKETTFNVFVFEDRPQLIGTLLAEASSNGSGALPGSGSNPKLQHMLHFPLRGGGQCL